ncbi:hypothetical protein WH95_18340 [Kiloniella litopenaei]|uniref:Uncharacterized protein n=2 Tax=Kiloniella litopenaei TaxID=1549748 RepID=A0A0M2R187_9PROT|nr:hypothetical protein WH95_18340 [Kiloniella litopenaei]
MAQSLTDTSEESLRNRGLIPLSGEEITRLILNKTITGEYVSTPSVPIQKHRSRWMEFYNEDGYSIYRYCNTTSVPDQWDCSNKLTGQWKITDNRLCLKYRKAKTVTHCFRAYFDSKNYMIVATTGKSAGYVLGIATKAIEGYVEEGPFIN